jgi:hypothetical protein
LAWIEIWFFEYVLFDLINTLFSGVFSYRVLPHERRIREACMKNDRIIHSSILLSIVNQGDRRPLLGSNTSRSTSPIPTSPSYQSITIPNENRQSFYSPVPSIEGMSKIESHYTSFYLKRKENVIADNNYH